MATLKLFDSDGDSSDENHSKIEVNKDFAKRYEYNKTRAELQKYEEFKKKGLIESDSEESSEEEGSDNTNRKVDAKFFDSLIKVKNKDPILQEKDAKLFESDDEEDEEKKDNNHQKKAKKEKRKPMYLKDVVSKHLLEGGPEFSDDDDNGGVEKEVIKTYDEEQEEIRQGFLKALEKAENDGGDGDFLRVKTRGDSNEDEDDDIGEKLDEYFGEDEKLDDETKFLKDYFRNKMWAVDEKTKPDGVDMDIDVLEDEDEIEKQEDYERDYNFRFEENAGDRIMSYSRKIEGSVRKKDNPRKSQRERKEERIAQAEMERREELKRLKNIKKKEINEKLEKIREVAGIGNNKDVFDKDDLDEEFDPEAHDRKMKEAFGEDYYKEDDVDPDFGSGDDEDEEGLEKPDFDKEDELLGLKKGWDNVDESGLGFRSTRQRLLKDRVKNEDEDLVGDDLIEDADNEPKKRKRKRKRKPSDVEKAVMEELLDEYYKLDYEDTIGDLKTRFKYKPVKAKNYGLSAEEVLAIDDKELNQYVSLKKLAPYRETEWEVPRAKTIQLKKSKKYLKENKEDKKKKKDKVEEKEVNGVESEKSEAVEANVESSEKKETVSRKRRRKQNQAEYKLSQSRLMAYGKIPSKAKSKKNQ